MTRIALIVVLALTACAKKPTTEEVVSTVDAVDPSAMRLPANPAEARTALAENFGRVYFDLDSSSLNPQSLAALQENAAILQRFPGLLVEIQGHADERGTTDSNLALGERRAEAVRKQLLQFVVVGAGPTGVEFAAELDDLLVDLLFDSLRFG